MCMHANVHVSITMYTCTGLHMCACIHSVCMCEHYNVCVYETAVCACIHSCMHMQVCMCASVSITMYTCMGLHMCTCIHS